MLKGFEKHFGTRKTINTPTPLYWVREMNKLEFANRRSSEAEFKHQQLIYLKLIAAILQITTIKHDSVLTSHPLDIIAVFWNSYGYVE